MSRNNLIYRYNKIKKKQDNNNNNYSRLLLIINNLINVTINNKQLIMIKFNINMINKSMSNNNNKLGLIIMSNKDYNKYLKHLRKYQIELKY